MQPTFLKKTPLFKFGVQLLTPYYNILHFSQQFYGYPLEIYTVSSDTLPSPPRHHPKQKILLIQLFLIGNTSKTSGEYLRSTHWLIHSFTHKAFTEQLLYMCSAKQWTIQGRPLPSTVKRMFRWNQRNVSWGGREESPITFWLLDGFVVQPDSVKSVTSGDSIDTTASELWKLCLDFWKALLISPVNSCRRN